MITLNPSLNLHTLFYDEDNNVVDWNVSYSLTNNSDILDKIHHFKLDNYYDLNRFELIKFHLSAINLVRLLNATNTKFKYRYYLNWFNLLTLLVK